MKYLVWCLVLLLIVAHQDFWFWEAHELVFGFLPIGMVYHIGISLLAAITWLLAVRFAWPTDKELIDNQSEAKP